MTVPATVSSPQKSASPSSGGQLPSTSKSQSDRMPWTGVLTPEQLATLRSSFGSLLICPGLVSSWGNKTDAWGRIVIHGAASSFWEAKDKLSLWQKKGKSESFAWWSATLEEKGITPITGNDIFDGLKLARWAAYRKDYQRLRAARLQRIHRRRLRDRAAAQAAKDDPADAANFLLEMGQSSSAS